MNSTQKEAAFQVPWNHRDAAQALTILAGLFLVTVAGAALFSKQLEGNPPLVALALTAALELSLLLVIWGFAHKKHGGGWRSLGLGSTKGINLPLTGVALVASLAFSSLYIYMSRWLGLQALIPPGLPESLTSSAPNLLLATAVLTLLSPLAEELFFRGFLLPALAYRFGLPLSAAITSVAFAIAHLVPALIIPTLVTGLLLAWLYIRTRSLSNCILMHATQNALALALSV